MTLIKITHAVGGHKADDEVELAPSAAEYLVAAAYAEKVERIAPIKTSRSAKVKEVGGDSPAEEGLTAG